MNIKKITKICFILAIIFIAIGAIFHVFRMHPENAALYQMGVIVGIISVNLFAVFIVVGIILVVFRKSKDKDATKTRKTGRK